VTSAFRVGLRALLSGDLLRDKIAIVTGAGRGIGEGIARKLALDGATVVCADVNESDASSVASGLSPAGIGMRLDVSKADECDALVTRVHERYGRLDILVNNAGINRDAMLHKMTDEQWHQVIAVDLTGVFFMTRAASRIMRAAGSGRIVNISSASWMGNIGQANYAASKSGLHGLTMTLAREAAFALGKAGKLDEDGIGLTVNAVAPGFISTEMLETVPEKVLDRIRGQIPLRRLGHPEEVARVVHFLAADASSYITGQVWSVNGGMEM